MRVAVMSHSFFRRFESGEITAAGFLEFCSAVGVEAVELSAHHLPEGRDDDFLRTLSASRTPIAALDLVCDLVQTTDASMRRSVSTVQLWVDRLADCGGGLLMLSPGGYRNGLTGRAIRSLMSEGLRRIVDYAGPRGVRTAIENHGGLARLRGTVTHIEEILGQTPGLGFVYDSGNFLLAREDPIAALRRLEEHVVHVHLKDFRIVAENDEKRPHLSHPGGGRYEPASLGGGVVPIGGIVDLLKSHGYAGFLSVEYEGRDPHPEEAVRRSVEYLAKIQTEMSS